MKIITSNSISSSTRLGPAGIVAFPRSKVPQCLKVPRGPGHSRPGVIAKSQTGHDGEQQQQQAPRNKDAAPETSQPDQPPSNSMNWSDESLDDVMREAWEDVKRKAKQGMTSVDAEALDHVEVADLTDPPRLMNKLATEMLGPVLQQIGVEEEPMSFFVDLCKVALGLQLVSCAMFVLVLREGLHMDAGEELRCLSGLLLGFLTRPGVSVERLTWPLYEAVLKLVAPDTEAEKSPGGSAGVQAALNQMGIIVAVGFFLPQLLFGWDTDQCSQLVGPMAAGWLVFDFSFLMAILVKLGP